MQQDWPVELLSPVGSLEHLVAVIANGANAVYLGAGQFNARMGAGNFSPEDLREVMWLARRHQVKIYVTFNILIKEHEFKDAVELAYALYEAGVDGLIVQDIGLLREVRRLLPDFEVHASTQMSLHNEYGAAFVHNLGVKRAVLARELSVEDIKKIHQYCPIDLEVFIHGALCICYSGQCYFSSLIGGRSGNRGRCAQICRLPFTLKKDREVIEEGHLLSPKDVGAIKLLPQLIEAGVHSFKIEGRLKKVEYAALVTSIYRKYLDKSLADAKNYEVEAEDYDKLLQMFNRDGFTTSYLEDHDREMMSKKKVSHHGLLVGKVTGYDKTRKLATVQLSRPLNMGDGIEVVGQSPSTGIVTYIEKEKRQYLMRWKTRLTTGDLIYKTSDEQLTKEIQSTYKGLPTVPLYGAAYIAIGEPMRLTLWDGQGVVAEVVHDYLPQAASNAPVTAETIAEKLSKLGNTPYHIEDIQVQCEGELFVPVKILNELRRRAYEAFEVAYKDSIAREAKRETVSLVKQAPRASEVVVAVTTLEQLEAVQKYPVARIELTVEVFKKAQQAGLLSETHQYYIVLPRILRPKFTQRLKEQLDTLSLDSYTGFAAGQLWGIEFAKGYNKPLTTDIGLNVTNSSSIQLLADLGAEDVTLSVELNRDELLDMTGKVEVAKSIHFYGSIPMMELEYCLLKDQDGCGNCHKEAYTLVDRKDESYKVVGLPGECRNLIYDSKPIYLMDHLVEFYQRGINLRCSFVFEKEQEVVAILEDIFDGMKYLCDGKNYKSILPWRYNRGHYLRGVE